MDVPIEVMVVVVCQPKATIVISVCQNCGILTLATLVKGADVLKALDFGRLFHIASLYQMSPAVFFIRTVPLDLATKLVGELAHPAVLFGAFQWGVKWRPIQTLVAIFSFG